jgi:hypothetical protein
VFLGHRNATLLRWDSVCLALGDFVVSRNGLCVDN